MKKRLISVLLAAFMVIALISGCGNISSDQRDTDSGNHSKIQDSEAGGTLASGTHNSDDKVNINVYHCTFNIASADSAEVQAIEDSINDYISDKINVKIKLTDLGQGEYEDKCNLAIADGEANLFWTAGWMNALSTDNLVSGKAVYDLSELLPGTDLYASIPKAVWDSSRYNGIPPYALAAMQGRIPQYSATMATVVVVIVPIMIAYPFFQKFFIRGLTIGSVKG